MRLTYNQAFLAAYTLLDDLHDQTKSDALLSLLSDMNPFIFTDRTPADPATWDEWLTCAKTIQDEDKLTGSTAFEILLSFIRHNETQYRYDLNSIETSIKASAYKDRWNQLISKVVKM